MFDNFTQDIKYLKGVGAVRARLLNDELNVYTLKDLLYTFPYKYVDRKEYYQIASLREGMSYVQVKGQIVNILTEGEGRKRRLKAIFSDGTGFMDLVWFNGLKYVERSLKVNRPYVVFGIPSLFGHRFSMSHPELSDISDTPIREGLYPYYNTTEKMKRNGLTSKMLSELMSAALATLGKSMPETLPEYLLRQERLIGLNDALQYIHKPNDYGQVVSAKNRLKFEELFYIQLNILRYAKARQMRNSGQRCAKVGDVFMNFYNQKLPFRLTAAQQRVIKEIYRDMASGRQMNRLLQGDVGSGKTMVALMSILIAVGNGKQTCLLAPTEILAEQHYQTLAHQLEGLPVTVALLTGNVKGKARGRVLQAVASGELNILIGTHAILENTVSFLNLGFVVIDEQHRFGVAQRARLWVKSLTPPHILVMTATPIPRTLAMTLYGDLDVSVLDELPPGRRPVKTIHMYKENRASLYESMRRELQKGHQIYYVFPLIKENEKIDLQDLEHGYEHLMEVFPGYKVAKLHGKMHPDEKDAVMQAFLRGETHILVSTTVIEVGVNVPNASVMVIEEAQRFGLSQLHQLRGRVGRNSEQAYCVLVTPYAMSETTRKRIEVMTETTDGFKIAEEDLSLRGPGDLEGTQQSGMPIELKISNLARDGSILQHARDVARQIVDGDPECNNPQNDIVWQQLRMQRKTNINWAAIS